MTHSRTSRYLSGLFSGYMVTFVTIAVGLWLTPFTLRFLDREEYAIFALSSDVLMWLNLLDFGITGALSVQTAQLTGRPDQDRLNCLASTAFFTQIGVVSLVMLVGAVIVIIFPSFFKVRPELQAQTMQVVGLMVLGTALTLGTQTFSALLVAHQQIHIDNLIRLVLIAIRSIFTVLLLLWGWKMLSLAVAGILATAITSGLAILRVRRLLPGLLIRFRLASWNMLRSLGNIGIWFSVGWLAIIFIKGLDKTVAGRLISLEAVTTLLLTGRLYALGGNLLAPLINTARPGLGQLVGQGNLQGALLTYRNLLTLSLGGAIVLGCSLSAANGCFVTWWVGDQNYGGWLLDVAFTLNLIMQSYLLPNRATLTASSIVKPQSLVSLVEGGVNLGLSVFLCLKFGIIGVVISTTAASILTSGWYIPRLTAKLFKQNFINFMFHNISRLLLIALFLIPITWLARYIGTECGGLMGIVVALTFTSFVGSGLLWILVFDSALKKRIREMVIIQFGGMNKQDVNFQRRSLF